MRMDLATSIRQAREKAGLTQRQLAKRMKVAPSAVAQWEGDATKPSIANRVDLASILAIPFAEMLPELDDGKQISVNGDPRTKILVRQFEVLPESVRESILMQVVAITDALSRERESKK